MPSAWQPGGGRDPQIIDLTGDSSENENDHRPDLVYEEPLGAADLEGFKCGFSEGWDACEYVTTDGTRHLYKDRKGEDNKDKAPYLLASGLKINAKCTAQRDISSSCQAPPASLEPVTVLDMAYGRGYFRGYAGGWEAHDDDHRAHGQPHTVPPSPFTASVTSKSNTIPTTPPMASATSKSNTIPTTPPMTSTTAKCEL